MEDESENKIQNRVIVRTMNDNPVENEKFSLFSPKGVSYVWPIGKQIDTVAMVLVYGKSTTVPTGGRSTTLSHYRYVRYVPDIHTLFPESRKAGVGGPNRGSIVLPLLNAI